MRCCYKPRLLWIDYSNGYQVCMYLSVNVLYVVIGCSFYGSTTSSYVNWHQVCSIVASVSSLVKSFLRFVASSAQAGSLGHSSEQTTFLHCGVVQAQPQERLGMGVLMRLLSLHTSLYWPATIELRLD